MKIQYEIGDIVFIGASDELASVVRVTTRGIVAETHTGERFSIGKREVRPTPQTEAKAKWVVG